MIELCQNFWRSASQHEEEFWTNITKSTQCQVSYPENFEWALSVVDLKNGTFCQLLNNDLENYNQSSICGINEYLSSCNDVEGNHTSTFWLMFLVFFISNIGK